jgi:hypothetical protein
MIISLSISIIVLAISIELRSRTARFLSNSGKWPAFLLVRSRTYSRGQGFERLVMAGGGVPRDVLSLFLEVLSDVGSKYGKIGKDDVRILSRANFERKIEELKQDSKGEEQDDLLKGIYIIREFCLEKRTSLFVVQERMLGVDPIRPDTRRIEIGR